MLLTPTVAAVAARHCGRIEAERWRTEEEARVGSRRAYLGRVSLQEALSTCRDGWREQLSLHHEPVALAWTRQGVDGYFLEGTDRSSLRQVRCDGQGVSRGPRVVHPLHGLLPPEDPAGARAEAPGEAEEVDRGEAWRRALAALPPSLAAGELAFELVRRPLTDEVLARRWLSAPEGATPAPEPADAPAFPLLVAVPTFRTAAPLPALQPLRRHFWLAEPEAALDLVAREVPRGARVSEMTLEQDRIEVQVDHPTKAFEGKPVAPYGDMDWDEYGVAERDWWYPREIAGFGCPAGRTVASVRAAFVAAHDELGRRPLRRAWYSCSPAYSNGRDGTWHLLPLD